MTTWFASDHHFNHKNIIKYCNRPYSHVDEMNEALIDNHNSVVRKEDEVYLIGDFGFCKHSDARQLINFRRRLNGNITFIQGNHDQEKDLLRTFHRVESYLEIKIDDTKIVLCHYPLFVWNKHHHGAFHIHGHCHGSLMKTQRDYYKRKVIDAGVDPLNYFPISFEQVRDTMRNRDIITVDHH